MYDKVWVNSSVTILPDNAAADGGYFKVVALTTQTYQPFYKDGKLALERDKNQFSTGKRVRDQKLALRRIILRTRPLSNEYPEYYDRYVSLVPEGDIVEILHEQQTKTIILLNSVSEEYAGKAYAPGKWTLKEVIGHMSDTERVMSYRMLAMARNEGTPLQGMDQDLYVSSAKFDQFSWVQLHTDLKTVRSATLSLISTVDDEAWIRKGTVWNVPVSTRAFAYIIAGHELHHLKVICDKYL